MKVAACAVLVAASLAVWAQESTPAPVKGADLELLRAVRTIATRVEQLRREPFERPPIAVRAPDAMREALADIRALNVIDRERMAARARAWADVGLDDGATPEALYRVLAADLAGIGFDPSGNRLLVSPERLGNWDFAAGGSDDATRVLLATGVQIDEPLVGHLLMHVRQRERLGGDWLAETTDATLAGAAWAEGEANLVALRYLFSGMGLADEVVTPRLDPADVVEGALVAPDVGRDGGTLGLLLDFVYKDGFAVAAETYRAGGWEAVGAAVAASRSTRDLLHPEQRGTAPVSLGEEASPAGGSWELADSDTLGEQAIFAMLASATGKDNLGLMAGDGWLADRLDRWEGVGESGITVWRSRWRTAEDAADFVYGYRRAVEARFPDGGWAEGPRQIFDTGSRILEVAQDGTAVRLVWAPGILSSLLLE